MKIPLIIVGARGMGRELASFVDESSPYYVKGFLDNGGDDILPSEGYPAVLGDPETWEPRADERYLIALGDSKWRRYFAESLQAKGAKFATFISVHSYVGANVKIDEGSIVCPGAVLTDNITIGKHCIFNILSSVSHDSVIGDYVTFSPGSRVAGRCNLKENVFLGANSTILPDILLAEGTIVGAGGVVIKSIESPQQTVCGVPVRKIERK